MEVLNADNLISGFRACGLHPVCADPVLAKLPSVQHAPAEKMDCEILEHLRDLRGNSGEAGPSRTRRTKLKVVPGCAVGGDSEAADTTSSSSSEEEEVISSSSDSDSESELPPKKQARNDKSSCLPSGMKEVCDVASLHVGDFLVIRLCNEKQERLFLSQITDITHGLIEVSFMKASGKNAFVFPEAEDKSVIEPRDIIGQVTQIKPDRRGSSWSVPFRLDQLTS